MCVYVHVCMRVYACVCVCVYTYVYMYINAHKHTHINTQIRAHNNYYKCEQNYLNTVVNLCINNSGLCQF